MLLTDRFHVITQMLRNLRECVLNRVILVIFLYSLAFCPSAKTLASPTSPKTIELEAPTDIQDLALLGQVWGFLKYHHPEVAKGMFNWDEELISFIPKYLSAQEETRDTLLLEWIQVLGSIEKCKNCSAVNASAYLKPSFKWLEHPTVPKELKVKIQMIHANRHQGENHYVSYASSRVGNPQFLNEPLYDEQQYPNAELRLLALFRLWNVVQYFSPYKHQTEKDWDGVMNEYILDIVEAPDELAYEMVILKFLNEIHDTHAQLYGGGNAITDWKGKFYPPVNMSMIENQLVVNSFNMVPIDADIDLTLGDVVTHIEGISVDKLIEKRLSYFPASNYPTKLRNIAPQLLRSNKQQLNITVKKGQEHIQQKLKLYEKKDLPFFNHLKTRYFTEPSYRFLSDDIGYVDLKNIINEDIERIKTEFLNTKGIILDIRNYPNLFLPFSLGSYFVKEKTPFVKFTMVNLNTPGEFNFGPLYSISPSEQTYSGKLVVLVNELTQSMAEYTAMAFQAGPNTTVIGSTTAGADGNISTIYLPGGLRTVISGIGVYYPDGKETQRVGILPDIVILPTIKGIREGRDELLEEAMRVIMDPPE
jgi:C-terminal processing protease CtpA/Prc